MNKPVENICIQHQDGWNHVFIRNPMDTTIPSSLGTTISRNQSKHNARINAWNLFFHGKSQS